MKIRPVGAQLFRADGRTAGHDEAKSHFSQFRERPLHTAVQPEQSTHFVAYVRH